MNKIDGLLQELCPNGVEYKNLGSFCKIQTGRGITNKDTKEEGVYPVISGGVEPMGFYDSYNRDENTVTIARAGSAGYVNFIVTKFYLNDKCFSIIPDDDTNTKYLYYALKNIEDSIVEMKSTGSVPTVNTVKVSSVEIPVPPLPIQEEIVRILDNFTELTAELTAELQDRKKQYEYYRDSLLTFNNDVKITKLKDVVNICLGLTATPNYVDNGVKFISAKDISKDYLDLSDTKYISEDDYEKASNNAKPKKGDVLFTRVGSNLGHPVLVQTDEKLCIFVSLGFMRVINENVLNNKYLKHWLNSQAFWKQVDSKTYGSAKVNLNTGWLNEFDITIPSLETQERIVNVLDNFEKICNDLKIGLPAEIELRQKQYEYYRDLLLTFPENDLGLSKQASKQASKLSYNYDEIKLLQYVYGYMEVELNNIANVTKLAGFEFTEYVSYSDYGNIIALRGLNVKQGRLVLDDVKYIDNSDLSKLNRSKLKIGDMLFTYVGTVGEVALIDKDDKYYLAPNVSMIRINDAAILKPKYMMYYFLSNDFKNKEINRLLQNSSMKNIPMEKIRKFKISIPSLEEQERIVSILDKFDKYCNDILEGLPAEIQYRKQQYEYYRNKLLTFKRLEG